MLKVVFAQQQLLMSAVPKQFPLFCFNDHTFRFSPACSLSRISGHLIVCMGWHLREMSGGPSLLSAIASIAFWHTWNYAHLSLASSYIPQRSLSCPLSRPTYIWDDVFNCQTSSVADDPEDWVVLRFTRRHCRRVICEHDE